MRPRTLVLALVIAAISWPDARSVAEDGADDLFTASLEELAGITVESASRHQESLMQAPAAITVITRDDILHSAAGSIVEVLQYAVGLDGHTKTRTDMDLAARGMAYDETPKMLVLIDGQPVNVAPYGGMQWPTLPLLLDDIERIEVVRGAASAVYGADAVSGVINIMTRTAATRETTVSAMVGEDGARHYTAQTTTALGSGWDLAASAGFQRTENDHTGAEDRAPGLPANWALKDHADIWTLGYRLDHQRHGVSFTSQGGFSTGEEGYNPNPGDLVVDRSRKRTVWLNNQFSHDLGRNRLEVRLGMRNLWQENQTFKDGEYSFKYRVDKGLGLDTDAHYLVTTLPRQTLLVGVNLSYIGAARDFAGEPAYKYDENETLAAVYLQDQIRLLGDRTLLTLSGRYDKWTNLDGQFSPRAALNHDLAGDRVNLRAVVGTSFRRPSFDENFYLARWPGGWFKGAAIDGVTEDGRVISGEYLEPEQLLDTELGLRYRPNRHLQFDVSTFRHHLEDVVGYVVYHSAAGQLNLGHEGTGETVTVRGIEVESRLTWNEELTAFINYAYQDAEHESPDGRVTSWRNAPRHKISGGVRYHGAVVVDLRSRYVDEVIFDEAPLTPVDGYTTVDLAVSRRRGAVTAKLSATNLLNDRHLEYPLYTNLHRRLMGTVRLTF